MTIQLPNNHIAVPVPAGSFQHFVYINQKGEPRLLWHHASQNSSALPPGTWSILSLKSHITEEQAKGVVEKVRDYLGFDGYKNYDSECSVIEINLETATKSFQSLCQLLKMEGEYIILKQHQ